MPISSQKKIIHHIYRVTFALFAVMYGATAIYWMIRPDDALASFLMLLSFPACFFCVGAVFNALMFPWPFNVFGPRRRTPRPSAQPLEVRRARFACFGGRCSLGLVKWSFFENGADISTIVGRVWLPRELVSRVDLNRGRLVIVHLSEEVRSPIAVPAGLSGPVALSFGPLGPHGSGGQADVLSHE